MSAVDEQIQCRKCRETIPVEGDTCPHCGTGIRSTGKLVVVAVLGAILAISSFWNIGQLFIFLVIGVVMVVGSGALIYDKRQRMQRV